MRELWVSCLLFCFAVTSAEPTRIRMVVKEDSEVVLNCSASGSVRDQVFDWKKDDDVEVFLYSRGRTYGSGLSGQSPQFTGRVAHFPEALDLGNASIKIIKAEINDSGNYTCTFPRSSPVLRSEISLLVDCILKVRPPGEGASPEPLIRIVDAGPDRALLQCDVEGARPRPAVQFQDSSGRVLPPLETKSEEREGGFYVTVRANVNRSDNYSCVVTQEEFCHQINSTTFVYIGACSEPHIRIVGGGPDWELWECEVKGAHPKPAVQWQDSSGRVLPALETESEERGGRFYVTVRAIVSSSGNYSCVVTPKEACRQNEARTLVYIGLSKGVFIGVTVGLVVLVVLFAITAVFLYFKLKAVKAACGAPDESNADACTTATDEDSSFLENQAPRSDGPVRLSTTGSVCCGCI